MTRFVLPLGAAVVGLAAATVALALVSTGGEKRAVQYRGTVPPAGIHLPGFALRDVHGRVVRSSGLKNKAVVVTFLDTACREACPVIANRMGDGLRLLSASQRRGVSAYAITVDPRVDTPARARAFLRRRGAAGVIDYLVGPVSALPRVWRAFEVLPAIRSGNVSIHSAPVRIYDTRGEWVSTLYAGVDLTPENLAHDLRAALGE